jgi:hypothetical protein
MRQGKKYFQVMIELTGFSKRFDCFEEAYEYAEKLAPDTGFELVLWEVDSGAFGALEMYTPLFSSRASMRSNLGTDVAMSNSKTKTSKNMEYKDLKELAWEERQRELHEAKMRLLRELDVEDQCVWGLLAEDEIDEVNLKLLRGEL